MRLLKRARSCCYQGKRSVLRKDLDLCVKHGCSGYAIELVGWTDPPETYRTEQYYEKVRKGYEYLVKACRARGLWLFVSVVNDNAGKSGKNPRNPTLDKQKDNVDFAFALVEKWGSRNVVVQPVAEAHNSFAVSLDQAWIPRLKSEGFLTVYNGTLELYPTKVQPLNDCGLKGDVNGDDEINIADVNALIDIILSGKTPDDCTMWRADVAADNELGIADVNALIDMILKM